MGEPTMQDIMNGINNNNAAIMNVKQATERMENSLEKLELKTIENAENIQKCDQELKSFREGQYAENFYLRKQLRALEQKQVSNGIVLKGFPDENFDVHEVKQNLLATFNSDALISECYKFKIPIGKDKKTGNPRVLHMTAITLVTLEDKAKLFQVLKEKGQILLRDLCSDCPQEYRDTKIWIEHRLSTYNLDLRKRLLELKQQGKIEGFMLRGGLFVMRNKTGMFSQAIFDHSQLDDIFGKVQPLEPPGKTSKRNRGSGSSPELPNNKTSRTESVKASTSASQI